MSNYVGMIYLYSNNAIPYEQNTLLVFILIFNSCAAVFSLPTYFFLFLEYASYLRFSQ